MQNTLILILSILGILITSYISIAHLLNKKVICPVIWARIATKIIPKMVENTNAVIMGN